MIDHLILVHEDERAQLAQAPHAMAALFSAQRAFAERLRALGALRDTGRLRPSAEGRRVWGGGHTKQVEHGPFHDGGRALTLYYWLRTASLDEALALAADCPALPADLVEVRPVLKGQLDPHKAQRAGKVFGFAVLGRASTEQLWSALMDRIDAQTQGHFQPDSLLAGVRLSAPSAGRTVVRGGVVPGDGPFMESKEVLGGLFFMRMPSLDEAVHWAAHAPFVAHGGLEVRALWRC